MQPYITKTLQAMSEPPVQLAKITIGDGSIGSGATFIELSTVRLTAVNLRVARLTPCAAHGD